MRRPIFLSAVVLIVAASSAAGSEQAVHFSDPNLKVAVEQTLGISNPTASDMLNLTTLFARGMGIVNLVGLEYAANLWGLYLENNRIDNISALSALTKLSDLFLYDNQISDIVALSELTNLSRLGLSFNPLNDVSALSGLVNLKSLYMDHNPISDISALAGLARMQDLFLAYDQISDISALAELRNLTRLQLSGNPLNADAYDLYIPEICRNNPGITLYYDPRSTVQIPTASTLTPVYIGDTVATLCGEIVDDGGYVCEYRFRYKAGEEAYTYSDWAGSATSGQSFRQRITGLAANTTYRFSAQARNSAGESEWGNELSFTTLDSVTLPPGFQAVEGFSSILGWSNHGDYATYRGQARRSYWEYAGGAHDSIEWETDDVPSTYTGGRVTFLWSGANGIAKGSHALFLNDMYVLTFSSGQATDFAWKNGNYELFFDFKNHNADNAGVYYLTVPCSVVVGGRGARIKVEAASSEGGSNWAMVHDFADTMEYEMTSEQLNYDHIGRADEPIEGNCSDGIQNGDETGVDCGGSCMTNDPEICNGLDDNKNGLTDEDAKFVYGHYYVRAALYLSQGAMVYVRDVNDLGYPVLVDVLGFTPEIDTYIVDFTLENFPGGYYTGLRTLDGIAGGNIALWDTPIRTPTAHPRNLCYDLLYETIHGLTEPLKRDIHTYEPKHGVMARGEDFDIIFEVEALDRLGATDCVDELRAVFYNNASFPHFPVYFDVREQYGWESIKTFLAILNGIKDETHVNTDDQECYYLSIAVGKDVSAIYEAHNKPISQETKDKIRRDVVP
jgi:hypothetical protein